MIHILQQDIFLGKFCKHNYTSDLYVYLDKKNNNNSVKLKNNIIKLFENFMSAFYENICNSTNLR